MLEEWHVWFLCIECSWWSIFVGDWWMWFRRRLLTWRYRWFLKCYMIIHTAMYAMLVASWSKLIGMEGRVVYDPQIHLIFDHYLEWSHPVSDVHRTTSDIHNLWIVEQHWVMNDPSLELQARLSFHPDITFNHLVRNIGAMIWQRHHDKSNRQNVCNLCGLCMGILLASDRYVPYSRHPSELLVSCDLSFCYGLSIWERSFIVLKMILKLDEVFTCKEFDGTTLWTG